MKSFCLLVEAQHKSYWNHWNWVKDPDPLPESCPEPHSITAGALPAWVRTAHCSCANCMGPWQPSPTPVFVPLRQQPCPQRHWLLLSEQPSDDICPGLRKYRVRFGLRLTVGKYFWCSVCTERAKYRGKVTTVCTAYIQKILMPTHNFFKCVLTSIHNLQKQVYKAMRLNISFSPLWSCCWILIKLAHIVNHTHRIV